MKQIESLYRSYCIANEKCPLHKGCCIAERSKNLKRCEYYDHMEGRRDDSGWIGFTLFCKYEGPIQLSLFD